MTLITRDCLKMLAAAIAIGLAIAIVAAGLALIAADAGEFNEPMPDIGTMRGEAHYRPDDA